MWPARGAGHALLPRRTTVTMAHPLDEAAWLDRHWFWAHPERRHQEIVGALGPDPLGNGLARKFMPAAQAREAAARR